jgi:isovaleryl-CoA dehydrogenase
MPNTQLSVLDHDLGPEIDLLRASVRDFAEDRIAPIAAAIDRDGAGARSLAPPLGLSERHKTALRVAQR